MAPLPRRRFVQAVTNEYREKCPELARIVMMKHIRRINSAGFEDSGDIKRFFKAAKACQCCGTIFTATNCTFRIKPKRKHTKRKNMISKSSNFLQILCHYCGWKTRRAGASRKSTKTKNGSKLSRNSSATTHHTPELMTPRRRFLLAVTNEYRKKCPELAKYFQRLNAADFEDSGNSFEWIVDAANACQCCGTIFTGTNCTFRIKPKRKHSKRKNVKNDRTLDMIPKSSNFLQILCHYCGWKTRQAEASRKSTKTKNGSLRNQKGIQTPKHSKNSSATTHHTPELSRIQKKSGSGLQRLSGKKKKTKSRLKKLLAKVLPSLTNFLATI